MLPPLPRSYCCGSQIWICLGGYIFLASDEASISPFLPAVHLSQDMQLHENKVCAEMVLRDHPSTLAGGLKNGLLDCSGSGLLFLEGPAEQFLSRFVRLEALW